VSKTKDCNVSSHSSLEDQRRERTNRIASPSRICSV